MRQIEINNKNEIINFCVGGGHFQNGINVEYFPDNFIEEFVPEKWLYVDGEYMLNPDYVEPSDEPASDEPTANEILDVLLGVTDNE